MKNSERPINPILDFKSVFRGLTKREYFAGLAMQGLLTRSPNRTNEDAVLGILESKRIAEESVIMSDELLKQLEQL